MVSLRAELTGRPDPGEPVLVAKEDSAREHAAATSELNSTEEPISSGRGTLLFAGVFSLFWLGASAAFMFGYFGPDELATLAPHILAFSLAIAFLPPFLFVSTAYALVRA